MATQTIERSPAGLGFRSDAQERITSDRLSFYIFVFSALSVLAQASLILINLGKLPPEVPIFYSRPWGEAMLAAPIFLWILPATTIAFVFINYFIALFLLRENYFLNRVLIVFSAIVAFATLYDLTRIVGLLV